jgi:hypothetical protein
MTTRFRGKRWVAACAVALGVLVLGDAPRAQGPVPITDRQITYIMPMLLGFQTASDAAIATAVQQLRSRIGEAPRVRVGFTVYVTVNMTSWSLNPDDQAAVRAALGSTISTIDQVIARAKLHGIPVSISFLTPIREGVDAAQTASQIEDIRNMQWHADNSLAPGWWTHSQYARKQRRVQEAYIRELGRVIASRMAANPATFVAATGDGEVELSYERTPLWDPSFTIETAQLADYSPFAVAEFRDWLRAEGLYAPGAAFGAEA